MYVVAGTRLTYVATWNETGVLVWTSGVSDILQQVSSALKNQYEIDVESSQVNAPALAIGSLTETITLQIFSGQDRNDSSDIQGNIDDAFANYGGTRPDSSDITSITAPASAAVSTGAPGPSSTAIAAASPGAGNGNVSSWWSQLTSSVEAGSVGFIVGGLAVVGVLVFLVLRNAEPV